MRDVQGWEELKAKARKRLDEQQEPPVEVNNQYNHSLIEELRLHQTELEIQNEELKGALHTIEASRQKYYDLYDLAPVGYFTIDNFGNIREVNLAGARLLGIDRQYLIHMSIVRFIVLDDRLRFQQFCEQMIESGDKQICELAMIDVGNRLLHTKFVGILLETIAGVSTMLIAVVDITLNVELERELRETNLDLTEVNRKLSEEIDTRKEVESQLKSAKEEAELYLDLMGHDISNIHQIILGHLELAKEVIEVNCHLKASDKELIENSLNTLDRGSRLIRNVQNLQKLKKGELSQEVIDIDRMISDTIREYESENYPASISCISDGEHRVMGNALLHDVFTNLIGNSIKHADNGSVNILIRIEHYRENGRTCSRVVIEDDGRGIPDDMKTKVFNRLHRGDTKARGMGMGLYLVKSLVEGFKGRVWVEDRVRGDHHKGSRFVVVLPSADK
jgi:PAS domain S-box-containing protein